MRKKDVTEKKNMWCFFFLHRHSGSRQEMQAKISIDVGSVKAISYNATYSFLASLIGHGGAGGVVRICV